MASLALLASSLLISAAPAHAAEAAIAITPASASVESNVPVTFTVTLICNGPGTCEDTQVSFPTDTLTGNGANSDFGSWVGESSCGFVTKTSTAGLVTFDYGDLPTGNTQCTFPVRAPEYLTLDGAQAVITPTVSGSSFISTTGSPAVLTLVAGHNAFLQYTAPATIISGGEFAYRLRFVCGENGEYTGDIGLSALHIEAQLPANFVYAGYESRNDLSAYGTFTPPAVGSSGGTFVYDDPTGASCGTPPLNVDNSIVITVSGTVTDTVGTQACSTATATFTYIDRATADTSAQTTTPCPTVDELDTVVGKSSNSLALANSGQYTFSDNSTPPYTFPGDWDSAGGSVYFEVTARTDPAAVNAGVSYFIQDPLPCLDDYAAGVYTSRAPGDLCDNPAYVPTRIVMFGFTPITTDEIVLHLTDESTVNVPFASGGWAIPATSAPVAQIDIPPFASEGQNVNTVRFRIFGHAAESAQPDSLLRNTASSTPYLTSTGDPIDIAQTATANILVADPDSPSGTVLYPSLTSIYDGACVAQVRLNSPTRPQVANRVEITEAPSETIYFDYLAPEGATLTSSSTLAFRLTGAANGESFTSAPIAAVITADYDGTGRDLYRWQIPAGTVTVAGTYVLNTDPVAGVLQLDLGAGCAGTYENDMTLGYGAPATSCVFNNYVSGHAQDAPMLPFDNTDLSTNGSPIAGNFCGYSAPLQVAAVNPGYSIDMTIQGNLDPSPVTGGANGRVSPEGGEAVYTVAFSNTGESNLTDPVLYNLLPRVGDTLATSAASRGSDFDVSLASIAALPGGVTVSYSTAENPCRPEVFAVNPGCVDDWSTVAPSPLSDTTALRFAYDGTITVTGATGVHGFEVQYTVSTPTTDVGDVALNSVGINVLAGDDYMGAAESTVVGIEASAEAFTVSKSASVPTYDEPGDLIEFTYTVTNSSAVALSGVTVTDALTDAHVDSSAPVPTCVALSNPIDVCSGTTTSLLPGQVAVFGANFTVSQADVDHGSVTDQATAVGQPPTGGRLEAISNEVTVDAVQNPALALEKSAGPTTVDAAGDIVQYSFTVANSGNVTITDVAITEQTFTGSGALTSAVCPATALAPTDELVCIASYTVSQEDLDAGSFANTAIATGNDPGTVAVSSAPSTAIVTADQRPSLALTKTATPTEVGEAFQTVTYTFIVENNGNVTMDEILVEEVEFTGSGTLSTIDCSADTLVPGGELTCSATYVVTQLDIDAGSVSNTARAVGTDPGGVALSEPPTDTAIITVLAAPGIELELTADREQASIDDVVEYTIVVTNSGNQTLIEVVLVDALEGLSALDFNWPGVPGVLAPGAQVVVTATYLVKVADALRGEIVNEASVTARPANGELMAAADEVTVSVNTQVLPLTGAGSGMLVAVGLGLLGLGLWLTVVRRKRVNQPT